MDEERSKGPVVVESSDHSETSVRMVDLHSMDDVFVAIDALPSDIFSCRRGGHVCLMLTSSHSSHGKAMLTCC